MATALTANVVRKARRRWYFTMDRVYCSNVVTRQTTEIANSEIDLYRRNKTWFRTPNYRTLKAQKKPLPDNEFSYNESKYEDGVLDLVYLQSLNACTGNPATEKERVYHYMTPTTYLAGNEGTVRLTDSSLRAKLIERAKGAEWSIPVFVGEGRETVNMVLNAAKTIGSAYRDLRRGNFMGALANLGIQGDSRARARYNRQYGTDPTRAAANAWLALTYGWTPLLNDVKNAAETLAEINLSEENRVIRVTARTGLEDLYYLNDFSFSVNPVITGRQSVKVKESRFGVWRCKPTSWNNVGSLGLLNPLSVAWELVPLSFVADWFLPIGRYLEGLDVPMRFQHLGGTLGYRREVWSTGSQLKLYGQSQATSKQFSHYYATIVRTPLTGAPTVGLSSIIFEPNIGGKRAMSAISLLRQSMTR